MTERLTVNILIDNSIDRIWFCVWVCVHVRFFSHAQNKYMRLVVTKNNSVKFCLALQRQFFCSSSQPASRQLLCYYQVSLYLFVSLCVCVCNYWQLNHQNQLKTVNTISLEFWSCLVWLSSKWPFIMTNDWMVDHTHCDMWLCLWYGHTKMVFLLS